MNACVHIITGALPAADAEMELIWTETNKNETLTQLRKLVRD